MAIHPVVLVTLDRRWRIQANAAGTLITIEHDGVFQARLNSLTEVERYLREQGIELAELISD